MMNDPRIKEIHEPLTEAQFVNLTHAVKWKSAIGHDPIAYCLSRIIGKTVSKNRANLNLGYDDLVLLVSIKGRLPEKPNLVEVKGNLTFAFVRFEKQTVNDIEVSQNKINELISMEE
jgi:hypothetical protein